jgi:hypothetical protein
MLVVIYLTFTLKGLLPLTNQFKIVDDGNQKVQLTFNISCSVDYSKIDCGNTESGNATTRFASNSTSVICQSFPIKSPKSELYLVWRDTGDRISQNSTIYRISSQYLSYLEGTPSGILGQNMIVKIKLEKPISKDVHKFLFCNGTGNPNATVTTLNDRDDEVSCEIVAQKNIMVNSGNQIFLKYSFENQQEFVGKTFLYVITFGKKYF